MFPLRDDNPRHGPAVVVWLLVAINVAVFIYQLSFDSQRQLVSFVTNYGFVPGRFFAAPLAEVLTLLSSTFIHGGLTHLVGNMFFLYVFADNIEDRMGHLPFVLFYLVGGVAATLLHGAFAPRSEIPMIGASGAISAVLGAYIVIFPRRRVMTFVPPLLLPWLLLSIFVRLPRFFLWWLPAWVYIGYWAAIQFFEATSGILVNQGNVSDVAWWAHVGGFAFGVLAVRRFVPLRSSAPRDA